MSIDYGDHWNRGEACVHCDDKIDQDRCFEARIRADEREQIRARLEKAESERNVLREELRLEKKDSDDFALMAGVQLEALRAALEELLTEECGTGPCQHAHSFSHQKAHDLLSAKQLSPEGAKAYAKNRQALMKPIESAEFYANLEGDASPIAVSPDHLKDDEK